MIRISPPNGLIPNRSRTSRTSVHKSRSVRRSRGQRSEPETSCSRCPRSSFVLDTALLSTHQSSSALRRHNPPPPLTPLYALLFISFIPSKTSKQTSASGGEQREPFLQTRPDGDGEVSSLQRLEALRDYYGTAEDQSSQMKTKAHKHVLTHTCTFTLCS